MIRESVTADAAPAVSRGGLGTPFALRDAWGTVRLLARRKPLGAVSAMVILGLVVVALLAPVLAPRDPYLFNLNERGLPIRMQAPTAAFPLGTDPLGRDVLSRIIYGARISLIVGLASVLIGTLLGTVLAVKQHTFIDAAQALGASPGRIVVRHVLPNVFAPILVIATVWLGNAIVIEAALSFLGLGTPPPTPTWGAMLSGEGRRNLETAPYLAIFPGVAISIVVLAFNMLGDALRDLLDPRLRNR